MSVFSVRWISDQSAALLSVRRANLGQRRHVDSTLAPMLEVWRGSLQHDTVNFSATDSSFDRDPRPDRMIDWTPDLASSDKPRYLAIADLIAADIKTGRLTTGDRLPPQRKLASRLEIDFTTVARGYAEAQKRGLIESRVGQGTYVRSPANGARAHAPPGAPRGDIVDFSMNLPPEPNDPALIERMQTGVQEVSRDIVALLRYQGFGGSPADKDAASSWLGRRSLVPAQERIFVTPGAHSAILGAFSTLAAQGETILCEAITYPGAGAHLRYPRRPLRHSRRLLDPRGQGRDDPLRGDHLSRRTLDRGPAWPQSRRHADGSRRDRARRAGRRLRAPQPQGALP